MFGSAAVGTVRAEYANTVPIEGKSGTKIYGAYNSGIGEHISMQNGATQHVTTQYSTSQQTAQRSQVEDSQSTNYQQMKEKEQKLFGTSLLTTQREHHTKHALHQMQHQQVVTTKTT